MQRIAPSNKMVKNNKNKQAIMPIFNMINNMMLLTTTSSEQYSPQYQKISLNESKQPSSKGKLTKSELHKQNDVERDCRPHTSSHKSINHLSNTQISKQKQVVEKIERNIGRPKSSSITSYKLIKPENMYSQTMTKYLIKKQENFSNSQLQKVSAPKNKRTQSQYSNLQYKIVQSDNMPNKSKIPKSITSNKSIESVKTYAVNSYKSDLKQSKSESRILIIANLTKKNYQSITSLYAIFESSKSTLYLDYLRDQFQIELTQKFASNPNLNINRDLLQNCFKIIESKFCQIYKIPYKTNSNMSINISNNFEVSYSLIFVQKEQLLICTRGNTKIKMSMKFGQKLESEKSDTLSIKRITKKEIADLDFVILISEGIKNGQRQIETFRMEHIKPQFYNHCRNSSELLRKNQIQNHQICSQIWSSLFSCLYTKNQCQAQSKNLTIHSLIGNSLDHFYQHNCKEPLSQNLSIIILAFENIVSLMNPKQELELPYQMNSLTKDNLNSEGCEKQQT